MTIILQDGTRHKVFGNARLDAGRMFWVSTDSRPLSCYLTEVKEIEP